MQNPFTYTVKVENETLNSVARAHRVTADDLRHWNPALCLPSACALSNTSWFTCEDPLPRATRIQLPPTIFVKGRTYGSAFVVAEFQRHASTALREAKAAVGLATSAEVEESDEESRPPFERTVKSMADVASQIVVECALAETQRILEEKGVSPLDPVSSSDTMTVPSQRVLRNIKDQEVLQRKGELERPFLEAKLECMHPDNQDLFRSSAPKPKRNFLSEARVQTVADAVDKPIDQANELILSFAFLEQRSVCVVKDVWAVLASQNIGVLFDAIQCKIAMLPFKAVNRFFFIGGVFYVDDRHEGWEDATQPIRSWLPSTVDPSLGDAGKPYGACPVRRVSQTTFADLRLKFNEVCLFRHIGTCDHLFYLTDVRSPGGSNPDAPTNVNQFPRRTFYSGDRSVYCDVCAKLPATIATYGDALCPHNPTIFCKPCFLVSHCDADGNEVNDGYVKYELPEGSYF